jgi:hypothetical protein
LRGCKGIGVAVQPGRSGLALVGAAIMRRPSSEDCTMTKPTRARHEKLAEAGNPPSTDARHPTAKPVAKGKTAILIDLLQNPEGATISAMMAAIAALTAANVASMAADQLLAAQRQGLQAAGLAVTWRAVTLAVTRIKSCSPLPLRGP